MGLRPDEAVSILDALEEHYSDVLSSWELDFVESLRGQMDARQALTPKQLAKLDEVFERVSGGGRSGGRSA